MRFITAVLASAILAFGVFSPAQAGPVGGSQFEDSNGCFIVWPLFVGHDCSWDDSSFFPSEWFGPISLWEYHAKGAGLDGAGARLPISGTMTVTGSGGGAIIDATLTMGAGERQSGCGQAPTCIEEWDSITHTISTAVNSATGNAADGYTYIVGSNGYPTSLVPCVPYFPFLCANGSNWANEDFPSVTASPSFPFSGLGAWMAPGANGSGPSSFEAIPFFPPFGPNIGTTSSAVASGFVCTQVAGPPPGGGDPDPCTASSLIGASLGYENILLEVDTNAAGGIISAKMTMTQEYSTLGGNNESWEGNRTDMSGFVAEMANNVQINRKNPLSVTLYGAENLDVRSIDISSLRLAGGLFGSNPTSGGEMHGKAHIAHKNSDGYKDLTAHFASNESDLMCGANEATVTGISDGVPFTTTVSYVGVGNKKDEDGEPTCPR